MNDLTPFPLDRTVPRDDIGFDVLNEYILIQRTPIRKEDLVPLMEWVDRVLAKATDNGKYTRRRIAEMQDRTHCLHLADMNIIYFCAFHWNLKGSLARAQRSIKQLFVNYRKGTKGTMYLAASSRFDSCFLFTAHFFDRFIERALDDDASRVKAVGKFLWFLLQRPNNRRYVSPEGNALLFCDEGAALGYLRVLTDREGTQCVPVYYFKTFVSRGMLTREQRDIENQAELVAPIRYMRDSA